MTFGLPKEMLTDQGSNFMSKLRKYCLETEGCWDEGVPYVVFARETVQESLGFSPADLVFGHTPRKENIISFKSPKSVPRNVYDYVHEMSNRLHD